MVSCKDACPAQDGRHGHAVAVTRPAADHPLAGSQRSATATFRQYSLRALFVLTTVMAIVQGFVYYLGALYLFKQLLFVAFTLLLLVVCFVGPLLITELLAWLIDWAIDLSPKSPLPGRRRF